MILYDRYVLCTACAFLLFLVRKAVIEDASEEIDVTPSVLSGEEIGKAIKSCRSGVSVNVVACDSVQVVYSLFQLPMDSFACDFVIVFEMQ